MSLNFSVTENVALYHPQERLILFCVFVSFFFFLDIALASCFQCVSPVVQTVKNLPVIQETWV